MAALARRLWRGLTDLVAPPHCLSCHARLSEPASLCSECWPKLRQIDEPVCDVRGVPFAYDRGLGALSDEAREATPHWDRARAAVAFDEASRVLVHALKYRDSQESGLLMARLMARAGRTLLADAQMVIPVPLHRWRLWRRRFNQSAFLAQKLAAGAEKVFRPDILERSRHTPSQVGLGHDERRQNVRRAFAVPPLKCPDLSDKRVLLVDDVLTTGATADACAAALKSAGAPHVDVLCFALVLEPRSFHI